MIWFTPSTMYSYRIVISIGCTVASASHRVWASAGSAVCVVVVEAWRMPPAATVTRHVTVERPTSWVFEHVTVSVSSVASVTDLFEYPAPL